MKKKMFSITLSILVMLSMTFSFTGISFAGDVGTANVTSVNLETANAVAEVQPSTPLLMKAEMSGPWAVKLSWNKVQDATRYVVYGQKCGKTAKKLVTKTKNQNTYTVKKIKGSTLLANTAYHFHVVAYNGSKKLKTSKAIKFIVSNTMGKYANVKSIKAKNKSITLSVGSSKKVGASYKMYSSKKHLPNSYGKALRFYSDNTAVAKVNSNGLVSAVSDGSANIYIQDIGGKYVKTKVNCASDCFTLSFDANGGAGSMQSQTLKKDKISTIKANEYTREGYTFKNWNTKADGTGIPYIDKGVISLAEDVTLYAQWEAEVPAGGAGGGGGGTAAKQQFSVIFDYMGHGPNTTVFAKEDTKLVKPYEPTEAGYLFAGWYKDLSFNSSALWDFDNEKVVRDTILYAHWIKQEFKISYYDQGGNKFTGIHEAGFPTVHKYGNQTHLKKATKNGYVFDGWYLTSECTGERITYLDSTDYSADISLYAKWRQVRKGDLITLDNQTDIYRVLKVDGTQIEVLAMSGEKKKYYNTWDEENNTAQFSNGKKYLKYEGSSLDLYLNEVYYSQLSSNIQKAIVPQEITQYAYTRYNADPVSITYSYQSNWNDVEIYASLEGMVKVKEKKKVYALDMMDIFKYYNKEYVTSNELNEMFFNTTKELDRYVSLRSARANIEELGKTFWSANGLYGTIGFSNYYEKPEACGAFTVDLSTGLEWKEAAFPQKGDLITLDGQSRVYRVIEVYGTQVEVLAMTGPNNFFYKDYAEANHTTEFAPGVIGIKYQDSDLDKYLNGTSALSYYGSLSYNIQNAIRPQNIKQAIYEFSNSDPGNPDYAYQNEWTENYDYVTKKAQIDVGLRNVYLLDVQDIYDYIGRNSITSDEINMMFFNQPEPTEEDSSLWLRSAVTNDKKCTFNVDGQRGYIGWNWSDYNLIVKPAFTIDLSFCSWEMTED